jgi:tetratricopeptide (TPR) repeat protein
MLQAEQACRTLPVFSRASIPLRISFEVATCGLLRRLGRSGMIFGFIKVQLIGLGLALCALAISSPVLLASTGGPNLSPEALGAMEKIYAGDPQAAIAILRRLEQSQPEDPLAFLLEAEAAWWQIYCDNAEVRYGMVDAWKRGKKTEDEAYLVLVDRVIALSQTRIAKTNSAEMHLYAGNGYALKARMYALRGENRAVAHAGVAARAEFLRALEIDPQMADATAGLGLYNYYVDSLSAAVKVLRFFMGIPGGDRSEGIRQMQVGIDKGVISQVTMRFYLAKNLRNFDREYEKALVVARPLGTRYPQNSIFQLLLGNLSAELGRPERAAEYFHLAVQASRPDRPECSACSTCKNHVREIADSFRAEQR